MSLCDRCYSPGRCCTGLALNGGKRSTREAHLLHLNRATYSDALSFVHKHGLPMFRPAVQVPLEGGGWYWRYACSAVTPEGRCSIYENRPQLCRDFAPGSDPLCVHSHGTEAGDPSAPVAPVMITLPELAEDA